MPSLRPSRRRHRPGPAALLAALLLVGGIAGCGTQTSDTPGSTASARTTQHPETSRQAPAPPPVTTRCTPSSAIAAMPLRDRLAQLLVIGVGARSSEDALSVVRRAPVGGLFLTGDATAALTGGELRQVQDASEIPLMVAVDDEGGRVQRVAEPAGSMPSARRMAATMSPREVYDLALRRGSWLTHHGVTTNLAPVLDVSGQPAQAVIGDRSFSADPKVVTEYAGAFARGMRDAGILPTFKHFPGQGHARGDSHAGTATTPSLAELSGSDLRPYRRLLDGEGSAVMLGHLNVPGLTEPGVPASLSSAAVHLLRANLGFRGLIITDDLYAMDAIRDHYGLAEAARMALAAGADMALMISAERLDPVLNRLEAAVADSSLPAARVNEAVAHVLAAKHVDPCAPR